MPVMVFMAPGAYHIYRVTLYMLRDYKIILSGLEGRSGTTAGLGVMESSDRAMIPPPIKNWVTKTMAQIFLAMTELYSSMLAEICSGLSHELADESDNCGKCMKKVDKLVTLPCDHSMCDDCANTWLLDNCRCCQCGKEIIAWNFSVESYHHHPSS